MKGCSMGCNLVDIHFFLLEKDGQNLWCPINDGKLDRGKLVDS